MWSCGVPLVSPGTFCFSSASHHRQQTLGETFEATLSRVQRRRVSCYNQLQEGCVSVVCVFTLTAASKEHGFLYIQPGVLGCVCITGHFFLMIHVHRIILLSIKHSTRTLHLSASFSCLLFDFPVEKQRTGMRMDHGKAQPSFSSHSKCCLCPCGRAERRLFGLALIFQSLVSRLRGGTCFKA